MVRSLNPIQPDRFTGVEFESQLRVLEKYENSGDDNKLTRNSLAIAVYEEKMLESE